MQAIITKYLGPTNHRGARVKASCQAGSIVVSWDHGYGQDHNHHAAATALANKLGWTGALISGGLPDGTGNAYVIMDNATGQIVLGEV